MNVTLICVLGVIFTITLTMFIMNTVLQIYGKGGIPWKIFNEKSASFTIKYPSNWVAGKYSQPEYVPNTVDNYFYYAGKGSSFALVEVRIEDSVFSNVTDLLDSLAANLQNEPKYKLIQQVECGKYMIKNQSACSQTVVYKLTTSAVKPFVKELTVATIDNDVQYSLFYRATGDLYDRYLPIGIEMIRSFNVTGTINEGEQEQVPELPPLSNTSDLNAI
jgi:hypothetical protein